MNNLKTKILALCLILTSFIPCIAQETEKADSSVNVIAFFSKNDTTDYRESYLKYKVINNDTTISIGYSEDFRLIVRDSTATDYTIECISTDFQFLTDNPSFTDKLTKITWDVTKKVPMIFKVDSLGTLIEIVNWKEIRNTVQPAFKVACEMLKNEIDENVINIPALIVSFNTQTDSEQAIAENTLITSRLFALFGKSLTLGEIKAKDETLGHPTDVTFNTYIVESDSGEDDPELAYAGDYGIKTQSVTKLPATELTDLGLDAVKQTLTDESASKIENVKSEIKNAAKDFGEATITVNEEYSYFFNGWPKYFCEEKIVDITDAHVVSLMEIEWTRTHWK